VPYLVPFLVILAVALFLRMVVPVTVRLTTNFSVRDVSELSRAFDARLVNYMQANYSGDPAQLEAPMRGLLAMARELAAQQREPIRDDIVQMMVVTAVVRGRFARRDRAQAALDAVLRAERSAA
jgi:hypothetical protein